MNKLKMQIYIYNMIEIVFILDAVVFPNTNLFKVISGNLYFVFCNHKGSERL